MKAGREYLFKANIRSNHAVVAKLGALPIAYHDQGKWQTIVGLVRAPDDQPLHLAIELTSLNQQSVEAEVRELTLFEVERPARLAHRRVQGSTHLVQHGQPHARIVIPDGEPRWRELAVSLQKKISETTGVVLPIHTDREATQSHAPILRPEFASANLILLGQLGNNRALWPAYNQFLTAVDGAWPGGDGYVIQTATNVCQQGRHHLIIGGTSLAGVEAGVRAMLAIIDEQGVDQGELRLPWLHKLDVQGECRRFFEEDDALWQSDPGPPQLPKPEPGYGEVIRWYRNIAGYYWSGREGYQQRADVALEKVLRQKAYTHHYVAEFFVRTLRMVEGSGWLDAGQWEAVSTLVLENFLDVTTKEELQWLMPLTPPYRQISLVSRHQIAPLMADWKMAQWLEESTHSQGGLQELIAFRRSEKERALTDFVTHRYHPSRGTQVAEAFDEVNASFFRFALERELYREFFDSGLAVRSLGLERINPLNGQLVYPPRGSRDTRLLLGMTAMMTGRPDLYWLHRHLPADQRLGPTFMWRYLGKVRRYTPPDDVPMEAPKGGIHPVGLQEEDDGFFAMRDGFAPEDDYLALNGLDGAAPAGSIVSLNSGGVHWLQMGGRWNQGPGKNRMESNGASAVATDRMPSDDARLDNASRLLWKKELPGVQALAIHQKLTGELEWRRSLLHPARGLWIIEDRFLAQKAGNYLLGLHWHPLGQRVASGEGALYQQGAQRLSLEVFGEGFIPIPGSEEGSAVHRQSWRALEAGEAVYAYSVIRVGSEKSFTKKTIALPDGVSIGSTRFLFDEERGVAIERNGELTRIHHGSGEKLRSSTRAMKDDYPIRDVRAQWEARWTYRGMLRALRVDALPNDGIYSFDPPLELTEIHSLPTTSQVRQGRLPNTIFVSDQEAGEQWRPVEGTREWKAGVETRNYGEMHPVTQQDETLRLADPITVRRIKVEGFDPRHHRLIFHDAARQRAPHPLRLEQGGFSGREGQHIWVASHLFPDFPRATRLDQWSGAWLEAATGKPLLERDFDGPIQAMRFLEHKGERSLFVLGANGRLEVYGAEGQRRTTADLYQMHQTFADRYREKATRAPVGGYPLPFSVGLWRADAKGERGVVIGRYGGFTFLDSELKWAGVALEPGGYGTPGLLEQPFDFGSGQEEQVAVERWRVLQLGDGAGVPPTLAEQRHTTLSRSVIESNNSLPLTGLPVLRHELLPAVSEQPRYLLIAREDGVMLYDARKRRPRFHWKAQAPIRGVAILEQHRERLRLAVATADALLWEIDWEDGVDGPPPKLRAERLPMPVASLREGEDGVLWLAGATGIWRRNREETMEQVAKGDFQSVIPHDCDGVITATRQGEVIAFHPRKKKDPLP